MNTNSEMSSWVLKTNPLINCNANLTIWKRTTNSKTKKKIVIGFPLGKASKVLKNRKMKNDRFIAWKMVSSTWNQLNNCPFFLCSSTYLSLKGRITKLRNLLWFKYLPKAKTNMLMNSTMVIQSNEKMVLSIGFIPSS